MGDAQLSSTKWQYLRRRILASHSVCHICGQALRPDLRWPDPMSSVVDHVTPRHDGGALLDPANLAPAHKRCNERKGAGGMPEGSRPVPSRRW